MLSQVALLGELQSPRDLIYILNTVRHAVGKIGVAFDSRKKKARFGSYAIVVRLNVCLQY